MALEIIGNRLRKRREELGLSMEEVANRIGVHKSSVQRYETNTFKTIKIPILNALAEVLDVPVEWLTGKDNHEPDKNVELDKLIYSAKECLGYLSKFNEQNLFLEEEEIYIGRFILDYIQSLQIILETIKEKQDQWSDGEAKFDSSELFKDEKELAQVKAKYFRSAIWDKTSVISEWIYELPNLYVNKASFHDYLEKECKDKDFTKQYKQVTKKYK